MHIHICDAHKLFTFTLVKSKDEALNVSNSSNDVCQYPICKIFDEIFAINALIIPASSVCKRKRRVILLNIPLKRDNTVTAVEIDTCRVANI